MTARFNDPAWLFWERSCVARTRRGDRSAFGELYRAFAGPLYSQVLMPRLGQRAAAEEALGETFRHAIERLESFRDHSQSIWHWLSRIAVNQTLDQHRQRARTRTALASFLDLLGPLTPAPRDPLDELEQARSRQALREAVSRTLAQLNPRYRRAIELRLLEDRSRDDCAQQLEISVPTFDVVLLRALRSFRAAWTNQVPVQKAVS